MTDKPNDAPIPLDRKSKLWEQLTGDDRFNAEILSTLATGRAMFIIDWNKWVTWNDKKWSTESLVEIEDICRETTFKLFEKALDIPNDAARKLAMKGVQHTQCVRGKEGMLAFAKCRSEIARYGRQFDQGKYLFNCWNGTLNLKLGECGSHRPDDMITRMSNVEFFRDTPEETRTHPLWESFLDDCTGGDDDLKEFLQRAVGYTLTGDTSEEKLFFVHGPAASGKSTFLEAIKGVMGEYAKTADFETFLKRNNVGGARNDVATLDGARMVISVEVDEGKHLAEGLVKQLTGGDTVTARFLYRESFEFRPAFKLWLAANDAPRISDADAGIWRRILRVPFENTVSQAKMDPTLKAKFTTDPVLQSAILSWAVRGCLKWQKGGLQVPASITEATAELRYEMDPLAGFIEDVCCISTSAHVSVTRLRSEYDTWAKNLGYKFTISPQKFNRRIELKGGKRVLATLSGKRCKAWMGIGLQEYSLVQAEPERTGKNRNTGV